VVKIILITWIILIPYPASDKLLLNKRKFLSVHRNRSTKIVATVGPSSSSEEILQLLFERGADVFRLNFSHGSYQEHYKTLTQIYKIADSYKRPIGILADLQGPKFRIGTFQSGMVNLQAGQKFQFDLDPELGNELRVSLPHPELFSVIKIGEELLLDDGKMAFRVDLISSDVLTTTALFTGVLSDKKGVNFPNTYLPIPILTEKDHKDLAFILEHKIPWIALSFVQNAQDILHARSYIGNEAKIIAKIEKPQAIENLEKIIKVTDAIMIARGDLGVELPPERVPRLQREILRLSRLHAKPVIVATQMLESMISSPSPTRAEVSDVATAVYLGTDATMLSAESASGQYPAESVTIMESVISLTEKDPTVQNLQIHSTLSSGVALSALSLIKENPSQLIVIITNSLEACSTLSSLRPTTPILVITSSLLLASQLTLLYGIHSVFIEEIPSLESLSLIKSFAKTIAEKEGLRTKKTTPVVLLLGDTLVSHYFSNLYWIV
jgi:pyruvate kinase